MNRPSDDVLSEQAYLVERGVRSLAVVGGCRKADAEQVPTMLAMGGTYSQGAVLWAVARGDAFCDYGYAASRWAVDLYQWTWRPEVAGPTRADIRSPYGLHARSSETLREPASLHLRVMDRLVTVRARRELVANSVDRDSPLPTTVGCVFPSFRGLVSGVRHGDSSVVGGRPDVTPVTLSCPQDTPTSCAHFG